jgi:hypothetical protein
VPASAPEAGVTKAHVAHHGNSGGREEFSFTQFTISPGMSPVMDTTSGCIDVFRQHRVQRLNFLAGVWPTVP